jgi:hypothetical protein
MLQQHSRIRYLQTESEMNRETDIKRLTGQLGDENPAVREQSRSELIEAGGHDVTRALLTALIDPRTQVRWEAAKALQVIADPVAAPALMHVLDDEDVDVRWVAGEALIALGHVGLLTVLSGLMKRAGSIAFCTSAHHVLHEMKAYGDSVTEVLESLEQSEPAVTAPPAAYKALTALSEALNVA